MICLDSTFLIDFLRNDMGAVKKAKELFDENLSITSVNVFEVLIGIYLMKHNSEKYLQSFESMIGRLNVLPFDLDSSKEAAKISSILIKSGNAIEDFDCLVAGIMKSNNCSEILTRNVKHFSRIDGINVLSY